MSETPDGEQAIPFFLELESIHNDLGTDAEYVILNTRKFFEMMLGAIAKFQINRHSNL